MRSAFLGVIEFVIPVRKFDSIQEHFKPLRLAGILRRDAGKRRLACRIPLDHYQPPRSEAWLDEVAHEQVEPEVPVRWIVGSQSFGTGRPKQRERSFPRSRKRAPLPWPSGALSPLLRFGSRESVDRTIDSADA